MADLSTSYMGIPLKNPIIAGASRLTGHLDSLKKIETAGAGAIVIKSLFEEQIEMERYELDDDLTRYDDQYAEMITIHPHIEYAGPEGHLLLLQKACDEISIPVFASLNAVHKTTWLEYAQLIEKTGIKGLELNFYTMAAEIDKDAQTLEEFRDNLSRLNCKKKWVYEREQYIKMLIHSDERLEKLKPGDAD